MSPNTPGRPPMDSSQRRGSWARAMDRVRAAVQRTGSSRRRLPVNAPADDEAATSADHAAVRVAEPSHTLVAPQPSEDRDEPATTLPAEPKPTDATTDAIAVDTESHADTDYDLDEPLLPMHPARTSNAGERSKAFFARYGMEYEPRSRRPQEEPPNKIRRVEKPIRLRVHWTCHECRMQFGTERVCTGCGHRKCRECIRHPPKRIREILDTTRQQLEQEERDQPAEPQQQQEPLSQQLPIAVVASSSTAPVDPIREPATEDPDLLQYRQEPAAPPIESSSPKGSPRTPLVTGGLPTENVPINEAADVQDSSSAPLLMTYARPRAAVVLKPKAQIVRRTCHKCESHIVPAGRRDCANCGHERCGLCPRYPPKKDHWSDQSMQAVREQAPMVKAVQRVYRKPRQRVRYTCEHCRTLFIDTDHCVECGHQRCDACHREPPRRVPHQHDPAVVEAVAARVAAFVGDPGQPPGPVAPSPG